MGQNVAGRTSDPAPLFRARGFGLNWQADIALGQFDPIPAPPGAPDILVARVSQLADRAAPRPFKRGTIYPDGFRIGWGDEAMFNMFAGARIEYCPQAKWRGELPAPFFSTVTALTLGWRGLLPLHATALEVSGKVVLIAGAPGAGKSTLAAELLQAGARLVSDDLSVLSRPGVGALPIVYRGRRSMRLHPQTAAGVDAQRCEAVPEDPRGKLLVWPRSRTTLDAASLCGLILLGDRTGPVSGVELVPILPKLLFRPAWMESIPVYASNRAQLLELARTLPAHRLQRVNGFSEAEKSQRIDAALTVITAMTG